MGRCNPALLVLVLCVACLCSRRAAAHAASDGYLTLVFSEGERIDGEWDLALRDLEGAEAFGPSPSSRALRPSDVRAARARTDGLRASALGPPRRRTTCPTTPKGFCASPTTPTPSTSPCTSRRRARWLRTSSLSTTPCSSTKTRNTGDLPASRTGSSSRVISLSTLRHVEFTRSESGRAREFAAAVQSGVTHIATGADRPPPVPPRPSLAGRLALRGGDLATGGQASRSCGRSRQDFVTAFTVAHSLTLSLAVLDVVRLPARVVEPAIAASIVVAAIENLLVRTSRGRWKLAFVLGLLPMASASRRR